MMNKFVIFNNDKLEPSKTNTLLRRSSSFTLRELIDVLDGESIDSSLYVPYSDKMDLLNPIVVADARVVNDRMNGKKRVIRLECGGIETDMRLDIRELRSVIGKDLQCEIAIITNEKTKVYRKFSIIRQISSPHNKIILWVHE